MSLNLKLPFIALISLVFLSKSFSQVSFTSSNLPIVLINTNEQTINDDPKIFATMGIIWNGSNTRNTIKDPINSYNGNIGIEIRGSSSQQFPKKSYGFETKSNDLVDVDVSLLGLPKENDWILYALYTDKTMIRDVMTYTLDASLKHYAPRCRYVELILNNQYQGVYVLMEKIKRNKNRVNISKLQTTDNSGDNLTGGYIIKIDKTTGGDTEGWLSNYSNYFGNTMYLYDYPKQEDITTAQKTYIQSYVRKMENAIYQGKYSGEGSYHEFLNDTSCIDFMIINELSKNIDGYRLSSYLYKGRNDVLHCGPIWDFNLGYGNANYYNGWKPGGFQYQAYLETDSWQIPFWWNKLMQDQSYVEKLKKRWSLLRKKELSDQRIKFVTDSLTSLLAEAQVRNFQKWPILGQYVWPNYYIGTSYESEIKWMKDWITQRLAFLDQQWKYDLNGLSDLTSNSGSIYPCPFTNHLNIKLQPKLSCEGYIELFNTAGSLVRKINVVFQDGQSELRFSGNNILLPGVYVLRITSNNRIIYTNKVVRKA